MNARSLGYTLSIALVLSLAVGCDHRKSPIEPTPVCTYTISPATSSMESEGGTGTVNVNTTAACAWTASAGSGWITITAGAAGTGPGTVTYSVDANATTNARNGALTVAGQNHTITQQGRAPAPCTYEVAPTAAEFTKDGGPGSFTVTAPVGCAWTATSSAAWLAIAGSGQGAGTGTVSYSVSRQNDTAGRTATIAVADRRFTVNQSGDLGACQYSVTPVAFSPCMPKGTLTATITTGASCPWTAVPAASWLEVTSGTSGGGSATISIAYTDNYDAPRQGVVMVRWPAVTAGQNLQVAQAGCRYAVSRSAIDVGAAGGTATFDVIQQSDPLTCGGATQDRCVWTAQSQAPWITITSSMPRSGDNPVAFAVAPNDSPASRTGTIVVRDKVVTVTQAGK